MEENGRLFKRNTAFTNKTVLKLFNITGRQLDYWVRTGLIIPSILTSEGRGSNRIYSFLDLIQINTIRALLAGGMSIQKIRKSSEYLKKQLGDEIPLTARLITDGATIFKVFKDNEEFLHAIDTLNHQGQGVLYFVQIGKLKQEVEDKVNDLEKAA